MILFLTILAFAIGALLGARAARPNRGPNPHRHEWSAFRQGDHARICPQDAALAFGSVPAGPTPTPRRARPEVTRTTGRGRIYLHSGA